ncbi:AAA family ATPase [Paenarthrobacter sp. NPDC090520]|uniref:AAA family ATPase n=1 Tax=Paenarthrobacter sp. NPDC090520 TaxID=3364382 RepID=UPI00382AA0F8
MTSNGRQRSEILQFVASELLTLAPGRRFVAIDGVDGSGKSTFASELAEALTSRPVIAISADNFLNLREVRYRLGRTSPEGFWLDTYDYDTLREFVLEPLAPDGTGEYRAAATDHVNNLRLEPVAVQAPADSLVIVEGMFLHRDELAGRWDYSVFLDVPFAETARRMHLRDGSNPDPEHPSMRRYVGGQRLYFQEAEPWSRATRVIDNADPHRPTLLSPREARNRPR